MKVPEGNVLKVKGRDIILAIESYNNRSDRRYIVEMPNGINNKAEFIGYIPGRKGEEAILDGTADQMFAVGNIPRGLEEGFYGSLTFVPHELTQVYRNAIPWGVSEDRERRNI
ncbi:MAG: hypothetical protein UV61_C0002G0012 [Candidatus Gottesmanbacteria bacterium GW2011_GWB1_43_11]|uniref:Uncharacterized protein n=1 Tax=Candidatus Gottesmanbacteria bacterium GW2011_GWB1_43_11 TaxID=1618446 RepID=A0A0G1EW95_9BACT|nr:MAG: hypothetical protein UV04_C0025G0012 [Candidatus Gottesmanbacteria bacterium GW2011_GWA2_42_16]KKS54268.1 MAG: hypothetical protein UV17_C0022G0009 [Candidatus Gottesmanbacteria bacterium GW2011_GWA1_42_26]KKS81305.1 MAG: hypothetical protein UV55_C0016G0011 [Candidatus Gottesmanbacteria bacterium GW2011_GWC1_43_10]KKS87291.1 MAG: hypothetical protein UV61_C0002G0012 [Candidatus Gottesmanbacteria bacterium GW2011_GWB1_43_11]OGG09393.1 MAG: hypothetical protein A2699_04970 [Candidatus Go